MQVFRALDVERRGWVDIDRVTVFMQVGHRENDGGYASWAGALSCPVLS